MNPTYDQYFGEYLEAIEKTLDKVLPSLKQRPKTLHAAMRYAVFGSGKRFRPLMVLLACEALGGQWKDALIAAASVELVHSYSLVHDDLPALDNDDWRRGQLSCHKKFGEALAILAGDALLTLAFQLIVKIGPAEKALRVLEELSTSAGSCGMIGGQAVDLEVSGSRRTLPELDYISTHKTGKLIKASAVIGALMADASEEDKKRMLHYGELIGWTFQTVDDLVDQNGYLSVLKPKDVRLKARDLVARAKRKIRPWGKRALKLQKLADFLLERMPEPSHVKMD